MEYYQKYLKYKKKYLQIAGGKIIKKLLEEGSHKDIKEKLLTLLSMTKYCNKKIGEGQMGSVHISSVGNTMEIETNNKKITVPVVVKEANVNDEKSIFEIKDIGKDLLIYSYINLNVEAILLDVVNELWYDKISPNLPLMIGYSMCDNKKNINKIITERHGLSVDVKFNEKNGFNELPMWIEYKPIKPTNLATLQNLLNYVNENGNKDEIKLPNNEICSIIELFDYLTISYLHVEKILKENKITLLDMHFGNIFIHWLNDDSYLGDTNIGKTKEIYYKHHNKYIKIKTFGLCLKIGDIGASIYHPQNDVYVVGQCATESKCIDIAKIKFKDTEPFRFMKTLSSETPYIISNKLVVNKILSDYPYNEMPMFKSIKSYKSINDLLPSDKLLDYFDKYMVDKIQNVDNTILIV